MQKDEKETAPTIAHLYSPFWKDYLLKMSYLGKLLCLWLFDVEVVEEEQIPPLQGWSILPGLPAQQKSSCLLWSCGLSCPVVGSWQWGCAQHWAVRQDQLRLLLYSSGRRRTRCLQRSYLARDIRRVKNERSPPGQLVGRRTWKHVAG